MEQHPIPQQISSYEFKLVGEMTLKQFGKAAAGIIIALLIYASPLVFFIKWPLILIFALGGLALAFVPFQDRALETWIVSFLRSIYSPTIYLYKKKKPTNWLDIDLSKSIEKKEEEKIEVPEKEEKKVEEFIESLPSVEKESRNENSETIIQKEEEKAAPKLNLKTQKLEATGEAVYGSIPMPDIPETPNTLVGMVMNQEGKIVEGAIVEIQDKNGVSARVMKSNMLGQFKTQTPLTDGKYLVITDKKDMNFDRVEVELTGKIVEPIKITAK